MNRHNDKDIKDLVSNFIDAFNLRPKYMEYRIRTFWKEEMSPMVNRYTANFRIKDKILFVHISSGAVRHDLFVQRQQIKELINEHLEEPYLEDVIIS